MDAHFYEKMEGESSGGESLGYVAFLFLLPPRFYRAVQ